MNKKDIQKIIDAHKKDLEEYRDQYQDELEGTDEDSVSDMIESCDFESLDFNIGFEQGYIRGMEEILSQCNK